MVSDRAVEAVARFLHLNYPCGCEPEDAECPLEIFEAGEIVDLVRRIDGSQISST